ncbi:MAG: ABC transporter permease [Thermotogota bacterium]|nr:ABC transporter permease [Thermotogota bacterium]
MLKKILNIFKRDIRSSSRDSMAVYIMVIPIILAVGITLLAPGLNDTTVNIALLKSDSREHVDFLQRFAKVEVFDSVEELEQRVEKRDDIGGIVPLDNNQYEILFQGNESEAIKDYVKALNALYEIDSDEVATTADIYSFGYNVPPLKTKLVNMLILLSVMLAGMLISITIVEEKMDNTISAINVTPISQTGFVLGKSMLGGTVVMVSIILSLLITGYYTVNWGMILLVGFTSMLLSLIIGFLQGLNSKDVIEAAGSVKLVMFPVVVSIAGYELLADKWQWTMYWSPFYWAYKANDMILSKTAQWGRVLLCVGIVVGLTLLVYLASLPRIRKGLS